MFIFIAQQQYKFQTVISYIMSLKKTGIILIYILLSQEIEISKVLYILDCTLNLLLLSQFN